MELLGLNTCGGAGKNTPRSRDVSEGRDVTGPAFLLSVHGLATLLWEAKDSRTVEVSRDMACGRAMLVQV